MKNIISVFCSLLAAAAGGAETLPHYYAHPAVTDRYGVIAPWYTRQNGQLDYRVRIAAETLKRYPWATKEKAVIAGPEYVFNGHWIIDDEGRIAPGQPGEWENGDLAQRAAYVIGSLLDYYAYSGDAAVFTPISIMADYLIDYCQTGDSHGWPGMLISVPTQGKHYGRCELGSGDELEMGKIQFDNLAQVGRELVRAYEATGNTRWYEAAKHWGDLLAQNRRREPGAAPWGRYANNGGGAGMNGLQTGGVALVLAFFDELIRTGSTGSGNSLIEARQAGIAYLHDTLLPAWTKADTWGRNFWDWECPVQDLFGTEGAVQYMLDHKDWFPNWQRDVRNILGLYIHHASVAPDSNGDVFDGAWAYPESSDCCGRSLWYSPMELAASFARYGVEADSEWAREIARRSQILATYDPRPEGQSMDLIDGGVMINRTWFKIAHPMALRYVLRTIGWLPEIGGANRENHIVRSTSVVKRVVYGKDAIAYSAYDAPPGSVDVLRLAYAPVKIIAGARPLAARSDLTANGYTVRALASGDYLVAIRREGATEVSIAGPDPQSVRDDKQLVFEGRWTTAVDSQDLGGSVHVGAQPGASFTVKFQGNQVRLIGRSGPRGGLADVYVDDFKQLVSVNCHSPFALHQQVLYYRNGLDNGGHTLKVVVRGTGTPVAQGTEVYIDAVQVSEATGTNGFGEGGGPKDAQRMIFGYTGRNDYVDVAGNSWRPATEIIARTGHDTDAVAKTWWTMSQAFFLRLPAASDPELYRYGVHGQEFRVPLTVGPGAYHLRLKLAETQFEHAGERAFSIWINGRKMVEGLDVLATAGGPNRPVDLVFNNLEPRNGIIELRFTGEELRGHVSEAIVQALELGPGDGGSGAMPKTVGVR